MVDENGWIIDDFIDLTQTVEIVENKEKPEEE